MRKYIEVRDIDTGFLCSHIEPHQFYWYATAIGYLPAERIGNVWFVKKMVKPFQNWFMLKVPKLRFDLRA